MQLGVVFFTWHRIDELMVLYVTIICHSCELPRYQTCSSTGATCCERPAIEVFIISAVPIKIARATPQGVTNARVWA
jgi:hypothetical protein